MNQDPNPSNSDIIGVERMSEALSELSKTFDIVVENYNASVIKSLETVSAAIDSLMDCAPLDSAINSMLDSLLNAFDQLEKSAARFTDSAPQQETDKKQRWLTTERINLIIAILGLLISILTAYKDFTDQSDEIFQEKILEQLEEINSTLNSYPLIQYAPEPIPETVYQPQDVPDTIHTV